MDDYTLCWVSFWILGTLNNLGFVVVGSAAKSLSDEFDEAKLIGVITWANVAAGLAVRALNAFALEGARYTHRIGVNSIVMLLGFTVVALSPYISFWFAVFGIVLIGGTSSFGESVLLGFLKDFDPALTGAWSSGTGMAGVGGSLIYLALSAADLPNQVIFLLMLPSVAVYWVAFLVVHRHKESSDSALASTSDKVESADHDTDYSGPNSSVQHTSGHQATTPLLASASDEPSYVMMHQAGDGPPEVKETVKERVRRVNSTVFGRAVQLLLVYFFEYAVSVQFAALANPKTTKGDGSDWATRHAFVILAFAYQFGVLISRSSVTIYQVKRVEVLTILQGLNFALWFANSFNNFMPLWLQVVLMVYVGLLGGAMYVNVFFLLVQDESLSKPDRELGVNITALYINIGIVCASVFSIATDETFLSSEVSRSG